MPAEGELWVLGHREKVRASPRGRAKVWALAGEREANTSAVLFLLFGWFYFFFFPLGFTASF